MARSNCGTSSGNGVCVAGVDEATKRAQSVAVDIGLGAKRRMDQSVIDALSNVRTGSITAKRGCSSSALVSTAITKACLFWEPRSGLPPLRSPPRYASSICTKPWSCRDARARSSPHHLVLEPPRAKIKCPSNYLTAPYGCACWIGMTRIKVQPAHRSHSTASTLAVAGLPSHLRAGFPLQTSPAGTRVPGSIIAPPSSLACSPISMSPIATE